MSDCWEHGGEPPQRRADRHPVLPSYCEEKFGADYSVEVIGPRLYADEMIDGVTVPQTLGAWSFDSMLTTSQAETLRVMSEFEDSTRLPVGDGDLVFWESGYRIR